MDTIIRYPEGHPSRVQGEAEYQAQVARRAELSRDPRITAAIEFIRNQGDARRPKGALHPHWIDETEALASVGLEVTDDAVAILRDWAFRARPVTVDYRGSERQGTAGMLPCPAVAESAAW